MKEQDAIKKRLVDLANRSYQNNQYTFTDFLAAADLSDFYELTMLPSSHEMALAPVGFRVYGGYPDAERCMVRFGNPEELGYEELFPIVSLSISPLQKKFADDLSHRDFLGALMNLGIERSQIGDILVRDKACFVFVTEAMEEIVCRELTRVKHTSVLVKREDLPPETFSPNLVPGTVQAKGLRLDSFIAKVLNLSRNSAFSLFQESKVFVNGRLTMNESYSLKKDDLVSVRGYGRFIFDGEGGSTRKGNLILHYRKYE